KRVLSYQADSHETLERFRRDAEAVASLDHPNILPMYEVSESEDGLPFFSMKFATGGSLHDATPSLRNEPRKCAQLMAKVARAVEYAHGRGILHRDLVEDFVIAQVPLGIRHVGFSEDAFISRSRHPANSSQSL